MELFDGYYYKSCKKFMELTGLWPYQSSYRRHLSKVIYISVNMTLITPLAVLLYQEWCKNIFITFENFCSLLFLCGFLGKYMMSAVCRAQFKVFLNIIAEDWQRIQDKSERDILSTYTEQGRALNFMYIVLVFVSWIIFNLSPGLTLVLDVVFPLNESRPYFLPVYANYIFFKQLDYHYWVCVHVAIVYFTCCCVLTGTDTTFVMCIKHNCGLFAIVCNRLENILKYDKESKTINIINDKSIVQKLRQTIILHTTTLECFDALENTFTMVFLLQNTFCVTGLSIALVYVLFLFDDIMRLIRIVTLICAVLIHLLYIHWIAQQIYNSSLDVFQAAYFSNWYVISIKARVLVQVIMIRSSFPCRITAGKITEITMNGYGTLLKTVMSYFTVLLSVM